MKAFVTKYALTKGIIEFEGEIKSDGKIFSGKRPNGKHYEYFHGKDFHLDIESAIKDCERRKVQKLESIKKQIVKIEKIKFN